MSYGENVIYFLFKDKVGVPWGLSGLRIQHCPCCGSSPCYRMCSIPGLGTSIFHEYIWFFFFSHSRTRGMWHVEVPGLGMELHHGSDPSCCSDKVGSLICCVTGEHLEFLSPPGPGRYHSPSTEPDRPASQRPVPH